MLNRPGCVDPIVAQKQRAAKLRTARYYVALAGLWYTNAVSTTVEEQVRYPQTPACAPQVRRIRVWACEPGRSLVGWLN